MWAPTIVGGGAPLELEKPPAAANTTRITAHSASAVVNAVVVCHCGVGAIRVRAAFPHSRHHC